MKTLNFKNLAAAIVVCLVSSFALAQADYFQDQDSRVSIKNGGVYTFAPDIAFKDGFMTDFPKSDIVLKSFEGQMSDTLRITANSSGTSQTSAVIGMLNGSSSMSTLTLGIGTFEINPAAGIGKACINLGVNGQTEDYTRNASNKFVIDTEATLKSNMANLTFTAEHKYALENTRFFVDVNGLITASGTLYFNNLTVNLNSGSSIVTTSAVGQGNLVFNNSIANIDNEMTTADIAANIIFQGNTTANISQKLTNVGTVLVGNSVSDSVTLNFTGTNGGIFLNEDKQISVNGNTKITSDKAYAIYGTSNGKGYVSIASNSTLTLQSSAERAFVIDNKIRLQAGAKVLFVGDEIAKSFSTNGVEHGILLTAYGKNVSIEVQGAQTIGGIGILASSKSGTNIVLDFSRTTHSTMKFEALIGYYASQYTKDLGTEEGGDFVSFILDNFDENSTLIIDKLYFDYTSNTTPGVAFTADLLNHFSTSDGRQLFAESTADGLRIFVNPIPEPAAFALVFGALAAGIALGLRNRR